MRYGCITPGVSYKAWTCLLVFMVFFANNRYYNYLLLNCNISHFCQSSLINLNSRLFMFKFEVEIVSAKLNIKKRTVKDYLYSCISFETIFIATRTQLRQAKAGFQPGNKLTWIDFIEVPGRLKNVTLIIKLGFGSIYKHSLVPHFIGAYDWSNINHRISKKTVKHDFSYYLVENLTSIMSALNY